MTLFELPKDTPLPTGIPMRSTLPTTSKNPIEEAVFDSTSMFDDVVRSAFNVSVPLTVAPEFKVTPPELLIVRFPSTELELGSSGPVGMLISGAVAVYWTWTVAPKAGAAPNDPLLREINAPLPIVRLPVFEKTPFVRVSVPGMTSAVLRETPARLLIVRLL
jgi:hypothetical protein